jgi:hypothetical protein
MKALLIRLPASKSSRICEDVRVVRDAIAWSQQNQDAEVSLDDAWAALHFLVSADYPIPRQEAEERGMSWNEDSLENVLMGGDATAFLSSFGPARFVPPSLVRSMAAKLEKISVATFSSRIDPETLFEERMLLDSWDSDTAVERLPKYFAMLQSFYMTAASKGEGVLIYFQ